MKKKGTKADSIFRFYNFRDFISIGLLYLVIIRTIHLVYDKELIVSIFYALCGVYIISILILSRFSFYENHLVIAYPTMFWSKGRTIYYSDILRVKERSFRYDRGFIIIRKGKYFKPELGRPGNSFPCNRKKKRDQIIIFIKSKNLDVVKAQ